ALISAATPTRTSRSAVVFTSAWAPPWRSWKRRSRYLCSWSGSLAFAWRANPSCGRPGCCGDCPAYPYPPPAASPPPPPPSPPPPASRDPPPTSRPTSQGRVSDAPGLRRFKPAAQVLRQEALSRGIEAQPVLGLGEAMALIREEHVLVGNPFLAQGGHDLLRLGLLDAWVVGALRDQQWGADLVDARQGRPRPQKLSLGLGVADACVELRDQRLPVGRGGLDERLQV